MSRKSYQAGDEPAPGYNLVDFLGQGGFGQVWKATGPGGIEVCIKIISDLSPKKGGKELRALRLIKGVRHPNLCPLTGFWLRDADGFLIDDEALGPDTGEVPDLRGTIKPFPQDSPAELIVAMGLADTSLYDYMEQCRRQGQKGIEQNELVTYLTDAARALDYLNAEQNIQHCDIKPQNILLLAGAAQVCDFGLAKAVLDARQTSMSAMSVAYVAPEVILNQHPSSTTDQYSLAITYYELRTGVLPYGEETITFVFDAKRSGDLDFSQVTEMEQEILAKATALDPDQRYKDSSRMMRALRRCCPADSVFELSGSRGGSSGTAVLDSTTTKTGDDSSEIDRTTEKRPDQEDDARWTKSDVVRTTDSWGESESAPNRQRNIAQIASIVGGILSLILLAAIWFNSSNSDPSETVESRLRGAEESIAKAIESLSRDPQTSFELSGNAALVLDHVKKELENDLHDVDENTSNRVDQGLFEATLLYTYSECLIDSPDWQRIHENLQTVEAAESDADASSPQNAMIAAATLAAEVNRFEVAGDDADRSKLANHVAMAMLALEKAKPQDDDWFPGIGKELLAQAEELLDKTAPMDNDTTPENAKERAAQRLVREAQDLLIKDDAPLADLFANPFGSEERATTAFEAHEKAKELFPSSVKTPKMQLIAALAAWHKTSRDKSLTAERSRGAMFPNFDESFARQHVPLILVFVESNVDNELARNSIIRFYVDLLELVQSEQADGATLDPHIVHQKILAPALALVEQETDQSGFKPDLQKKIAHHYSIWGRLLVKHPYEDWNVKGSVHAEALRAFDRALEFDQDQGDYFAGRGFAKLRLQNMNAPRDDLTAAYKSIATDAQTSIDKSPNEPSGHALLGNVLVHHSRITDDMPERRARLTTAIEACGKAVEIAAKDQKTLVAHTLTTRSTAIVELVNYSENLSDAEKAKMLGDARDDAQSAVDLKAGYQDFAYLAKGNALEDLGWLAHHNVQSNYDAALDEFTKAIKSEFPRPIYWMARGRCRYKAVVDDNLDFDLKDAASDLQTAIDRDEDLAEAYYWLGKTQIHQNDWKEADQSLAKLAEFTTFDFVANYLRATVCVRQGNLKQADTYFAQALKLVEDRDRAKKYQYLFEWAQNIEPHDPSTKDRIEKLQSFAESLTDDDSSESRLFIGLVHEAGGETSDASAAYSRGLTAQPLSTNLTARIKYSLYFRRNMLELAALNALAKSSSTAEIAKTKAKQIATQLIGDADQAIKLGSSDQEMALANSHAAHSRLLVGKLLVDKEKITSGLENFRQAIKLAPEHPQCWEWRYVLVRDWQKHIDTNLAADPDKLAEAKEHLDQALKAMPAGHPAKRIVGRLRDELIGQ